MKAIREAGRTPGQINDPNPYRKDLDVIIDDNPPERIV